MTIGETIKKARISKGLTQTKLAKKSGVANFTISLWETNKAYPSIIPLICIADVLNVTLDELVGRRMKSDG